MEETVKKLSESIGVLAKEFKDTRADLNTMAKYFKDDNTRLKKAVEGLNDDLQRIDEAVGSLIDDVEELNEKLNALESFGGGSGGNVSGNYSRAIFDDMADRDAKLVENVQQVINGALMQVKNSSKRRKILGIF
ncbi:TPA: hypothetical protein RPW15_001872 [Campylobacter fetus subsp. venerealis]|nr:hypothetical protein [Campylobacter fetus subsp. venerealis]HDX6253945.1 hypothetical protein [Campylobacter fetus subsp. venerealis]HDX6258133.1 hypothetical protein [Campylobacter fetus subsp. venerealis]HDX6262259.1 hypothetical protein [Campylobacter fetus subsp. venerealis]HDX6263922.1 hypothetical protein [Campylobacter fetus subsp. venerealis]